jgi:hypothetical protein
MFCKIGYIYFSIIFISLLLLNEAKASHIVGGHIEIQLLDKANHYTQSK